MLLCPDFPTGGIINNKNIPNIMKAGHGSLKIRAIYKVYEIPYSTSTESLILEIGKVAKEETTKITNIRNESNNKGLRIVIECKKTINP